MESEHESPDTSDTASVDGESVELDGVAFAAPIRPPRSKRIALIMIPVVAAAVIITLVLISLGAPGSSDASAQVARGARTTLAEQTVDLQVSGSLTLNGQSNPITGTGEADLATNVMSMTANFNFKGETLQESLDYLGSSADMQLIENGQNVVTQVLPGDSWVQLPYISSNSTVGSGTPDVLTQLQLLESEGDSVTALGPSTINGISVNGYQVTITQKGMAAALKRLEAQSSELATALKAAMRSLSDNSPVIDLWIDNNNLIQRETTTLSLTENGQSASGDVVIDFLNYGAPVSMTVPKANEVASYSAFLSASEAASQ